MNKLVVDDGRSQKTTITFGEIADRLLEDRASAQAYVDEAEQRGLPPDRVDFIKFQH